VFGVSLFRNLDIFSFAFFSDVNSPLDPVFNVFQTFMSYRGVSHGTAVLVSVVLTFFFFFPKITFLLRYAQSPVQFLLPAFLDLRFAAYLLWKSPTCLHRGLFRWNFAVGHSPACSGSHMKPLYVAPPPLVLTKFLPVCVASSYVAGKFLVQCSTSLLLIDFFTATFNLKIRSFFPPKAGTILPC